ncbi:MAG: hypothetical protein WB559_08425 [Candidatus Acidiferrales bacterium]
MPIGLEPNSIVTLQALSSEGERQASTAPAMFQVVRVGESKDCWEIAAWKMGPERVWPVELSGAPVDDNEEEAARKRRDDAEQ